MSSTIVKVVEIEEIRPHSQADRLFIAKIKGWQTIIKKLEDDSPQFKVGERVVYVPPDCTISREMAVHLGIANYLSEKTNINGERELVVRRVRLRGEPSYGFVMVPDDPRWPLGKDVREHYGIGKYMPPVKFGVEDAEPTHPLFEEYTNIENLRNFPDYLLTGEEVIVTEKIHGTNARVGYINEVLLAGSHHLQRKRPERIVQNLYWFPTIQEPVMHLLNSLRETHKQVILFGEIYGMCIQKLHYGRKVGLGFTAFDLFVDGKFLDYDQFKSLCDSHGVESVPVIGRGHYSLEFVKGLSSGQTTLPDSHIREGVVVKPIKERFDPRIGRVILKYLNDDYLLNDKLTSSDSTDI